MCMCKTILMSISSTILEKYFNKLYRPLCLYALNITESYEESEDIVQQIFVELLEKAVAGSLEVGDMKGYLYTVVRNRAVKYAKKKRRGINMRKYQESGKLETVICNGCGKKLVVERGILREGGFSVNYPWDYFSEKDGEVHHFDLCEDCYDEMTAEFRIPVDVEDEIELL